MNYRARSIASIILIILLPVCTIVMLMVDDAECQVAGGYSIAVGADSTAAGVDSTAVEGDSTAAALIEFAPGAKTIR